MKTNWEKLPVLPVSRTFSHCLSRPTCEFPVGPPTHWFCGQYLLERIKVCPWRRSVGTPWCLWCLKCSKMNQYMFWIYHCNQCIISIHLGVSSHLETLRELPCKRRAGIEFYIHESWAFLQLCCWPWSFLNNLPLNCMEIAWGCMGNVLFKVSQERPQHHQPRHWFTDAGTANTTFSDNMTDILCEIQDSVRLEIQHVSTWTSKWFNAAHQPISPSASWLWRSSGATSATKAAACTAEWPELWNRLCHAT